MQQLDPMIVEIQDKFHAKNRMKRRWILVQEEGGRITIHEHSADGVAPPCEYQNRRIAASRLLQLWGIGPVSPQTHPEEICLGSVTFDNLVTDGEGRN